MAVQKEIQEHLKERPEYVVTTSEFNDVKAKLLAMHNRRANDHDGSQQAAPEPETRLDSGSASDGSNAGNSGTPVVPATIRPAHVEAPARRRQLDRQHHGN